MSADSIRTLCPACGGRTLFVGEGGYLTCSLVGCPNPVFDDAITDHIRAAEQVVAEWFDQGVPIGFTVASWLTVCRTTFSTDGKPTTHATVLQAGKKPEKGG